MEDKLRSYLGREKLNRRWDNFKNRLTIFVLSEQMKHDSWIINRLRNNHPDIFKVILKEKEETIGKSIKRELIKAKFIDEMNKPIDITKRSPVLCRALKLKERYKGILV